MSEYYYHLTAEVNDMLVDVLVSVAELNDYNGDYSAFFLPDAKNITNQGMVSLSPTKDDHVLPETFG